MENVLAGGVRREMRDEKWCKADGGDCVMNAFIEKKVHELYWDCDVNCARTMLICLGELFGVTYELYLNGLGWEEERIFTR